MPGKTFVNLHNHTSHSARDGLGRIPEMVAAVAADGQPGLAGTDHGNISGAWKLDKECRAAGIKPVIGIESYMAIGSRLQQDYEMVPRDALDADGESESDEPQDAGEGYNLDTPARKLKQKTYEHLTILAQTPAGFSNLSLMSADAADHFWGKPRMDFDLLREHHDGLILLSGCASGPVAGALLRDGTLDRNGNVFDGQAAAKAGMEKLLGVFGGRDADYLREHLFVEVMEHGIPAEQKITPALFDLARHFGLRAVATNDSHYTRAQDHLAHDMWLCIGSSSPKRTYKITDPDRWKFSGSGYHLRTYAEMVQAMGRYGQDGMDALAQSLVITESIQDCVLPESRLRLPSFPTPEGFSSARSYFKHLIKLGAAGRYGSAWETTRPDVRERIAVEYQIICSMGFADYFLIVDDFITWCRSNGIRVGPGRGSAAGSMISYCLDIVRVDPLAAGLLFERFLDPSREEMPDIDVDVEQAHQGRAFNYLTQRWGSDFVARLGTFGFTRARAAIKNSARTLLPAERATKTGNLLANLVPGAFTTLTEIADPTFAAGGSLRDKLADSAEAEEVFSAALAIEGVISSEGVHACGVVISTEPLPQMIPLRRDRREGREGTWVTQWDGKDIADLGVLKLDVLGLRNLDIIERALAEILRSTGEVVDVDHLSTDPAEPRGQATWDMLSSGKTAGVFQLESAGITRLAEQIRPNSMEDLSALVALYRPGPLSAGFPDMYARRKHGLEPVDYSIFTEIPQEQDALKTVLHNTFGLIVYQEQLMQLGTVMAGFGPAENNRLRRAVSKKKKEEMIAVGKLFMSGATTATFDEDGNSTSMAFSESAAVRVWDGIKGAGDYSFNKSHSFAYAVVAYMTAYLKASWPAQFGAATLACTDSDERRAATLSALRGEGIAVLSPSVRFGDVVTSCGKDLRIRLGLAEIKDVGKEVAQAIVNARAITAPITTVSQLVEHVKVGPFGQARDISAAELLALVEAGACDDMEDFAGRKGQIMAIRALAQHPDTSPIDAEFGAVERSARERERLGTTVSASPLYAAAEQIGAWRTPREGRKPTPIHKLPTSDNAEVTTLGVLSALEARSYGGGRMARITLEGSRGSLDGVMFDAVVSRLDRCGQTPQVGDVVAVRGRLRTREVIARTPDDVDPDEDHSPVEPEYRQEIMVNDIYPVELADDSRMELPDNVVSITGLIEAARKAREAQDTKATPQAATPPPATSRTRRTPEISAASPAPTPASPQPSVRAPEPDVPEFSAPAVSTAQPEQVIEDVVGVCVLMVAQNAGALPDQLGADRSAVLSAFPQVSQARIEGLRVGQSSELFVSVDSCDYLLAVIAPAGTEARSQWSTLSRAVINGGPASILAALQIPPVVTDEQGATAA